MKMPAVGERYGRWTVIGEAPQLASPAQRVSVRCDCGCEKVVRLERLESNASTSCGCTREKARDHRAEWYATVRARGICWICRRAMLDEDPRLAHAECTLARAKRRAADVRANPPVLGQLKPYVKQARRVRESAA